jgi:hypothetical protein
VVGHSPGNRILCCPPVGALAVFDQSSGTAASQRWYSSSALCRGGDILGFTSYPIFDVFWRETSRGWSSREAHTTNTNVPVWQWCAWRERNTTSQIQRIQIGVSCATAEELNDCEVWLVSARKVCKNHFYNDGTELVPEKLHCVWSIQETTSLNLKPTLKYFSNVFYITPIISNDIDEPIGKASKAKIYPLTTPQKSVLTDGINEPGQYRLKITVTASKGVPPASASLIFDCSDYDHVSLTRETDILTASQCFSPKQRKGFQFIRRL